MKEQTRRSILKTTSGALLASGALTKSIGAKPSEYEPLSTERYEQVLETAKDTFNDTGEFKEFQKVIDDSKVSSTGKQISTDVREVESEDGEITPHRHRESRMDVNFYLYGPNLLCPASETNSSNSEADDYTPTATDSPEMWDAFFFFEHDPPVWSVGGESPRDVFSISFADRHWYIPSDPREDTSSKVTRDNETPYGRIYEYSDGQFGNDEEYAQVQVVPDDDDIDPEGRQVFGSYSHHWSGIDVENVSISTDGSLSVTVSDSSNQWTLNDDPDTGDPLKSSVQDHFDC